MTPNELHDASVGSFDPLLAQLAGLVERVAAEGPRADTLLQARLAPDMLPFERQVAIAAQFALRGSFPLAGLPVPPFGDEPPTVDGLRARIARVRAALAALPVAALAGAEGRIAHERAGDARLEMPAPRLLQRFVLPNFCFHLTIAYAILRAEGLPVGKADFDGLHEYPAPG